ncbi:MAG: prepilin-type N-terminal cleavage/methylation domain-containing protein [Nocardioidaceae bacterium]|nr:prepilin-type N-terminal cleavage/methylation domain-containing protein [Nocardioidaceae bacterium]
MINTIARHRRDQENGEGGFTLIELLVVVVIIGILTAIAVPLYLNYQKGANDKAAQSDLRGAVSALEQCMADNGAYPTAITTAGATTGCTTGKVTLSSGTAFTYKPATGTTPANYSLWSTNSKGSASKFYCYVSTNGGSIKTVANTNAC